MVNVDSWWDALVRDRFQSILELVLDAVADDYGTVEIILKMINDWNPERDSSTWPARSAVPVSRPEVVDALRELTREGYIQAFVFDGAEPRPIRFREDELADVWFYATKKGVNAARRFLAED